MNAIVENFFLAEDCPIARLSIDWEGGETTQKIAAHATTDHNKLGRALLYRRVCCIASIWRKI